MANAIVINIRTRFAPATPLRAGRTCPNKSSKQVSLFDPFRYGDTLQAVAEGHALHCPFIPWSPSRSPVLVFQ
jgi:hypothetical protein